MAGSTGTITSTGNITRTSACSGELLGERLQERTMVVAAEPPFELVGAELALGLDHGPLAMRPFGLDRVQPRTPAWQAADQEAAAAVALGLLVVAPDPGADLPADVPSSIVPDQGQNPNAF